MENETEARLCQHPGKSRQRAESPSIARVFRISIRFFQENAKDDRQSQCTEQKNQQTCTDQPVIGGCLHQFIVNLFGFVSNDVPLCFSRRESETFPTETPAATTDDRMDVDAR